LLGAIERHLGGSREEVSVTFRRKRHLWQWRRRDGEVLSEEYNDGLVSVRARVSAPVAGACARPPTPQSEPEQDGITMAAPSHGSFRPRQGVQPAAESYSKLLNLPNFLTLCRLVSIPIFLTFLTRQRYEAALYVFAAAAVTDGLDGAVARWFDSRTELGAFLDPFADKLMLVSAFVVLTIDGELPGYLLSVVMIRDIVIGGRLPE